MTARHPLHGVAIHCYHCPEAPNQRAWIAMFAEYKNLPIYFPRPTREAAYQAALHWQNEAIEKHEYTYLARKAAAEKARRKKAAV